MGTTRRVVLGVLGGAGALIVGYAVWPGHRLESDDAADATGGDRFLANWIKIGTDGAVTVVIPHCDMGTGIFTGLGQIAADELDVDFDKLKIEQAPPDPLFANGALAEGFLLGGVGIQPERIPAFLRGTVDNTFRLLAENYMGGLQVTGGSSAIRATGVYGIRVASAAVREMLVKAAAARWKVDVSECTTGANRVTHARSGRSFGYGELVADAAKIAPSAVPPVKARSQYRYVGKPVPRIDIPAKVNGTEKYGLDVVQPGMLYAAIRISPVFGGKLMSVDASPLRSE